MSLVDFDFIEIGTSDFETLIELANDKTVGLSVEPLSHYLDKLPNKENVKKINCAIAFDNIERDCVIYFLPESTILENNLKYWLKGCNSINDYHYQHKKFKIEHLVETKIVKQIPISKLLIENNVRKIKHLKIDTEGGDCDILMNLKNYLKERPQEFYPEMITFESNKLTSKEKVACIIDLYSQLGYVVQSRTNANTVLVKEVK